MSSWRLVESYGNDGTIDLDGRTYPAPCLCEDEDGIRFLFVLDPNIPVPVWTRAHTAGVSVIVHVDQDDIQYRSTEEFMDRREEVRGPMPVFVSSGPWSTTVDIVPWRRMKLPDDEVVESDDSFVHLHAHSEYSGLDGLSKVQEMVDAAVVDGQPALALSDHGVCAGHPELQKLCLKAGINPIFALEAYLVNDRFARGPDKSLFAPPEGADDEAIAMLKQEYEKAQAAAKDYYHLILIATDDKSLQNLWAMSTEANRDGIYYHPRLDWDTLERLSEGVIATTACLRGPIAHELLRGHTEAADANLGRLLNIFGDRLYLELGTCDLPEQHKVNQALIEMSKTFSVPTVAVVDSHYPCYGDRDAHRVWIAAQTNKDLQDETSLFEGDTDYHLMSAKEVRQYLSYLPDDVVIESMRNTVKIASQCTARIKPLADALPVFSKNGATREERIRDDVRRLTKKCLSNWHRKLDPYIQGDPELEKKYEDRFEYEMRLLIDKKFCGYFNMVWDYVAWAKEHNILVGPGRGSGGACLVAFLSDITEIEPVSADLIFERFLTPGRTSLPDFDVDFPTSKREVLTQYLIDRYGEEAVVRVGTHVRLKNKGVIRDLFRVLKNTVEGIHWPDVDAICKVIERAEKGSAGLGLSWEDLWVQAGEDLEPYRQKYPMIFDMADHLVGRLKSYGKHAAGVVISAEGPLTTSLPMRLADDQLVAEFDMDALEELGLVKFDLLTLRTLDTIQMTFDMAREIDPHVPSIYSWTADQYEDPDVWNPICDGDTLGIFQIETRSETRLAKQFKPRSIADLADVITLVRPGPDRSGLTKTYFRRRSGQEPVSVPDPRLESVLTKTYGCIVYQEDVMRTCMILGGYSEDEADRVRKILGKKQVEKVEAEGREFLERVVSRGMEQGAAQALWNQLAEFAKYSFNRAHAWGYAVLGFWTAWFKKMYPHQFLVAALSTVDADRVPEFVNDARKKGYTVMPPDVNASTLGFQIGERSILYGLDGIKGVGEKAVPAIMEGQPYGSFEDFMERKGKQADMGVVKIMVRVGCFDSLVPNRRALEDKLLWETSPDATRCVNKDDTVSGPNGLPCIFDWDSEPPPIGKSGRPLKKKPPPKRCTRACRQYVAPTYEPNTRPYTDEEIREAEKELLGIYLSSTPFDRIPEEVLEDCRSADELETAPDGTYLVAATVGRVRSTRDRHNRDMGFMTLFAQDGEIDLAVFYKSWAKYHAHFAPGRLALAYVKKDGEKLHLKEFAPL